MADVLQTQLRGPRHIQIKIIDIKGQARRTLSADQLIHFYNDNRKSIKVWKKLAINLIHRMCNNAYILYKKNTCHMPIKSRLRFVQDVVEGLTTEHLAAREDREGHVGRAIQPRRVVAIVRQIAGKKEKDCIVCSDRANGVRRRSRMQCTKCNKGLHFQCRKRHACCEE
ncbi:uncharacterized protein LOC144625087 [Crassostrea virginica]